MSSCETFDHRHDLNIQRMQSLSTGHAHVQISGLYYEVNKSNTFSMIEGKLQEYQINVIQMYKFKLPKIHVTLIFCSLIFIFSK